MVVIIFTFILLISNNLVESGKVDSVFKGAETVKCNNRTEKKLEDLMQILVPVGTDVHNPETQQELRKHCNLFNKNLPFILGFFKHCTKQFGQTIAKFMFFPIRKQMEGICKTGKLTRAARELLTAGKCGNLARVPFAQCNTKFIDAMNGITRAPVKSRIYMVCCHSNAYRLCLREASEDTVGCTRHTIDWAEKFVLKMIGGSISMVCGEYFEESDKCTKLIMETPKSLYTKSNPRPKTFVRPMIGLMESFPDIDIKELQQK